MASDAFLHSGAWWLLLAAPVVFGLLLWLGRLRARAGEALIGDHVLSLALGRSEKRRSLKRAAFALATLLGLAALLGPAWGNAMAAQGQRGVDLVVCLDVSRSMLARDQSPSRLAAAQDQIAALADRAGGDRMALVLFAGDAELAVPLTRDVASLVQIADESGPLSILRGGTDLGAALDVALTALGDATGEHEAILVLTDGEDVEERGLEVAGRAAARGIAVHCVGVGSRLGSKIAVDDGNGETFVRDAVGNEVVSVMDEVGLGRVAEATGGVFRAAVDAPASLVAVYEDEIVPMARKAFEEEERNERENRYQWPLAAALGLLLFDLALPDRRLP
jgi:Ca-activated chloride channel family protein